MSDQDPPRSSLDELREMEEESLLQGEAAPKVEPEPKGGGSLLDDLLAETQMQARKEMDEVAAALKSKQQAEADAKQRETEARRRELDEMRRQEAERRQAIVRERERRLNPEKFAGPSSDLEGAEIETPSGSGGLYAGVFALILLIGAGGWYYMDYQAKQKAAAAAEAQAAAEAKEKKEKEAVAQAARDALAKQHAASLAQAGDLVRSTTTELRSPRRQFEMYMGGAVPSVPVAKKGKRSRRRRAVARARLRRQVKKKKKRKGGIRVRKIRLDRL